VQKTFLWLWTSRKFGPVDYLGRGGSIVQALNDMSLEGSVPDMCIYMWLVTLIKLTVGTALIQF